MEPGPSTFRPLSAPRPSKRARGETLPPNPYFSCSDAQQAYNDAEQALEDAKETLMACKLHLCHNANDPINPDISLADLPPDQIVQLRSMGQQDSNCYELCGLNRWLLTQIGKDPRGWRRLSEEYVGSETLPLDLVSGVLAREPLTKDEVLDVVRRARADSRCYREPLHEREFVWLMTLSNKLHGDQPLSEEDVAYLQGDAVVAYRQWNEAVLSSQQYEQEAEQVDRSLADIQVAIALYIEEGAPDDVLQNLQLQASALENSADDLRQTAEALRHEAAAEKERLENDISVRLTTGVWLQLGEKGTEEEEEEINVV